MKINEMDIQEIQEALNKDASLKLYLEEACEALHLSLKYDSDFIFALLDDDVLSTYDDNTLSLRGTSHQFEWKINANGFEKLSDYALQREYFLDVFHRLFCANYKQ